ncbi:FKBP-type peptidyl-prolyl cis-trans isomerase [Brumicola nitratireducens]|uniref:Peptidyl-prolyl cis-trans isomerase n=1 Tax=Glaciecola nitratireducens (strain JCM 12485 / KCTC 12276 / FR1064) TaxID=1085623 RepID=G4QDT6_GLANF|nr:peptidylprolyl isomerase [Glaciecola nitratireducens]AEP31115.1 peptidyl-prolyl cis-trans isomerase, FKBP-type [Glaciecola nitratireducens FR1064]
MIADQKVVSLNFTVKDSEEQIIDSSEGGAPLVYLHGQKNIIPGLEAALEGKAIGDEFDVTIEPAEGYGDYNEEILQVMPKEAFQGVETIEPGMVFTAQTQKGPVQLAVTKIEGEEVTVDPNHPLAGKTLNFTGSVIEVRDATEEELAHGHVHGEGGHQH